MVWWWWCLCTGVAGLVYMEWCRAGPPNRLDEGLNEAHPLMVLVAAKEQHRRAERAKDPVKVVGK